MINMNKLNTFLSKHFNKLYFLLNSIIGLFVLSVFVRDPGIDGYYRAYFTDIVNGTAHRPFMYRALVPGMIEILSKIIPNIIEKFINQTIINLSPINYIFSRYGWNKTVASKYFFALIIIFSFLLAFGYVLKKLYETVFKTKKYSYLIVPISLLALPPFFSYYSYLYDFPTLFFTTTLLLLLYQRNWSLYIVVFFLACLNKETTILITILSALYLYKKIDLKRYLLFLALQSTIFAIVKIFLYCAFRDNPGMFFEFQLTGHNLGQILQPYSFSTLFIWLAFLFLIFRKWKEKPNILKLSLASSIPLIVSSFVVGVIDELRVYYELFPATFLLIYKNITEVIKNSNKDSKLKHKQVD